MIIGGHRARRDGSIFVTAHVAQSLDGRIACNNGHSQWISNTANLHHAHRLRALHQAVLVGRGTVEQDNPQLTVRHVEGENPTRIIISGRGRVFELPSDRHVFQGAGSTVLCSAEAADRVKLNGAHSAVEVIGIEQSQANSLSLKHVALSLAERGMHSIFVEGGGTTVSSFLEQGMLDLLHLHVAPMILGSGIRSFSLPEIQSVKDSHGFAMTHFDLDGELLLECRTGVAG